MGWGLKGMYCKGLVQREGYGWLASGPVIGFRLWFVVWAWIMILNKGISLSGFLFNYFSISVITGTC